MNMKVKPRYLLVAVVGLVGLYLLGVSPGGLLLIAWAAFMLSMHLGGGHGGHGGHGGPAGPAQSDGTPAATGAAPHRHGQH